LLLKPFFMAAALFVAAPAFAGPAPGATAAPEAKAKASSQPQGEQGGTCSACDAPGGGGVCSTTGFEKAQQISDEEWKAYVRKKFAQSEAEKPEPVDPDPFAFSVYRGQRPEPMGSQTIINGAQMEIATLIVKDPPGVVAKTYYETFERMGFPPLVGDVPKSPGVRYLSFRPTGSKKLKTVTLVPSGSGTVILASVGNPEALLVKKPELPGKLPVPPNARASSAIQQLEGGAAANSALFLVRDSTPEQVREFYRRELAQRGFEPVPNSAQLDSESFEKDGVLVSISARPHTEPNTVAVSLMWLE
jgi:hypothetical protein